MLFNWLFRWIVPFWDDMTTNPITGKASQKNVFQVFYGMCGVGGAAVAIWADVKEHRPVNTATILFLLLAGLGLAGLKIWQGQMNRETATPEGQPLAVPNPPGGPAPEIMQQPENPNVPTHQSEQS